MGCICRHDASAQLNEENSTHVNTGEGKHWQKAHLCTSREKTPSMALTRAFPGGQPTRWYVPAYTCQKPELKVTAAPPSQDAPEGHRMQAELSSLYPARGLTEYVPACETIFC